VNSSVAALDASIDDLLRLHDEIGVLSVTVGVEQEARRQPHPWEIQLDNDLRALRTQLRADDRARRTAVEERLDAIAPALADLVDAAEEGRGRALYAGVASGELQTFRLQVSLPTKVVLGKVAHVLPLLRVDDGRIRVIVLVGYDAIRVIEVGLGRADEVQRFDIEPVVFGDRDRRGPAPANPLRGQQSVSHRERWDRHVEAEHHRRLTTVAGQIARLAARRRWTLGVVAGDPRVADFVVETLEKAGVATEFSERDLIDATPLRAAAELSPILDSAVDERDLELVRRARGAAAARQRGAAGLDDVLAALNEARVETLVLDGDRQPAGALAPDGQLVPAAKGDGEADPQFGDRLVVRAHDTGARTAIVGGAAAEALADADGVAALLRS